MKKNNMILGAVAAVVLVIGAVTFFLPKDNTNGVRSTEISSNLEQTKTKAISATDDKGDIVILISDISETASFYKYEELENPLEIIAVRASDGTIRTAFNTCQICYSSGRGYYEQEGSNLVCQNCKNRFTMDDVAVTRGGCNPIPIDEENKTVTDTQITIPKDFLEEADQIFANWKA